uniref:Uncharacterized protein n=2 Tax=Triticum urartu TaxID=4572 RepID=A0A8R7TC89_TRIUA
MSSPACRPGLPAPRRQAPLLPRLAAPPSGSKRAVHRTRPAHSTFEFSSPGRRRRTRVISSCHGGLVERRRLLLIPAISLTIGSLQYSLEKGAAKAEFTDMPALRGKDYGKTKMSYPDYTETESGLQYKDLRVGEGPSPKKGETVVIDWDGYTIGYYGRIFEARNKTKGGSFEVQMLPEDEQKKEDSQLPWHIYLLKYKLSYSFSSINSPVLYFHVGW